MRRAIGLVFVLAIGCGPQEELKPDPGVSPFYPGPSADTKPAGSSPLAGSAADLSTAGSSELESPLRTQDVEKQLRIALRAGEKGDLDRASALLDRILALEPINREALFGRAVVAMKQSQRATSPQEKLAAIEKAGTVSRSLRRAYERSSKRELELLTQVHYDEIKVNAGQGRFERAIALLKELNEVGFDPFDAIDRDPEMAKLRAEAGYKALVASVDAANLARAKARLKDEFARTANYRLDFNVNDLDGKPLSLDQFKGKVLLLDVWGTWCAPCRDAIPGLIQLYHKNRRRGFEIIGLDHEQDVTNPERTRQFVKQFVQEAGIPYPIAMLDEELEKKIPDLNAYPTTILIDRQGMVRLQLVGGGPEAHATIDAAVEVLLAEPEGKRADTNGTPRPQPGTKSADKAPGAPPSDSKQAG